MKNLNKTVDLLTAFVLADNDADRSRIAEELRGISSAVPETPVVSVKEKVQDLLTHLGIPCNLSGYRYIVTAVCSMVEGPDFTGNIVKGLYSYVADQHGTTASRVERGIRHAVEVGWQRGDMDVLHQYFESTVSCLRGKPTNCEFLYRILREVNRKE